jgi:hypothetical protein
MPGLFMFSETIKAIVITKIVNFSYQRVCTIRPF